MLSHQQTSKLSLILVGVVFLCLVFNGFSRTAVFLNVYANVTVTWTFNLSVLIMFLMAFKNRETIFQRNYILFHCSMFLFVFGIGLIDVLKSYDHLSLFHMMLYISFFLTISFTNWTKDLISLLGLLSAIVLMLFFWNWIDSGYPTNRYEGYFTNPNLTGVFVASLMYFPIAAFKGNTIGIKIVYTAGIIAGLIVTYFSTARGAMLLLVVAVCSWLILKASSKWFNYLFHLAIAVSGLFVLGYHFLAQSSYASRLNEWSIDQFGKRFFSGRQNIWGEAIDYGLDRPFFGYKIGIEPKDFMPGTDYWHTHNQFVQVFLESGLVGLTLFLFMLYGIWKLFQKNLDSALVQWSASFFLGIIVYQTVEISLFFNMKTMGLFHWMIIGVGISGVMFKHLNSKQKDQAAF